MPRPGFVLDVDRSTPPILFWHGEDFSLEKLPAGRSRVIYPPEPLAALDDIDGAIRHALLQPARPGSAAGAAVPGHEADDRLRRHQPAAAEDAPPDIRQRVIEAVLDLAADAGVDDVHLIAALALHRRMTEAELRHAVGDRVYDAFAPARDCSTSTTPRTPTTSRSSARRPRARRSRSTSGPPRATCSSTSTSTRRDGRRLEVHRHRPGLLPQPAPPPQPARRCSTRSSFMDQHKSELH